ncbi:MAG: hypothetical protein VXX66_02455, partial [Actinomycetota bacterium]|nr:hypothetical protein [Actinomycetota bacterium]
MIDLLLAALLSDTGKPSDPDAVAMWIDDLGRLTPFGRTFDVYIQTGFDPEFSQPDGTPRPPYRIGSTRGNESPSKSFGWAIEGPVLRNRNEALYPFYDNCQDCIEYDQARVTFGVWELPDGTQIPCSDAGVLFDCFQANPYQTFNYLGANFTPINWIFQGPAGCCPTLGPITDLEYFWCDSWILHGQPGQTYGTNGKQTYPRVQQQHKDLIDSPVLKFWLPQPTGQVLSQTCCDNVPQYDNFELITWPSYHYDWQSKKHPGSFHIARFTGPDYF